MKIIIFFIFFYSASSLSGEKIVETRGDNYVAFGYSDKKNKELAKSEACNSAKKELITFVFGASFQINQNMIRSLGVMDYSQDVAVNTGEVVLRAAMTETNTNDDTAKCTITYPMQEANIERDRLKSTQNNKNIRFTEIGDSRNMKGGVLEIVTIPEDTDVLIDNVRWGSTPLRLYGKLDIGTHTIRLDNPNYKIIEEKFEIGNASKTRIDKILKRATAKLKIITDPEGANVKINEDIAGHTPTQEIELIAGQKLKIEVSHPETETNVQYVTLIRDEVKTLNQKLLLKPGFISLNVIPNKDVAIAIDNIERPTLSTNSWIQLEAGSHEVTVSAKDYAENTFAVDLKGGEKQAIPTIELVSLKEIEKKRLAEEKNQEEENNKRYEAEKKIRDQEEDERKNPLTTIQLLLGVESNINAPKYSKPSYGFFIGVQKSFLYNYMGIQLLAATGVEDKEDNSNSSASYTGKANSTSIEVGLYSYTSVLASLPIYLGNFYLNPGLGIRNDKTEEKTTKYNSSGYSTGTAATRAIKTSRQFTSYSAGFIFPKNVEPNYGSIFIEGGINKYQGVTKKDTSVKMGFRWNFK